MPVRMNKPTPPSQTLFLPTPKSVKGFKKPGIFNPPLSLPSSLLPDELSGFSDSALTCMWAVFGIRRVNRRTGRPRSTDARTQSTFCLHLQAKAAILRHLTLAENRYDGQHMLATSFYWREVDTNGSIHSGFTAPAAVLSLSLPACLHCSVSVLVPEMLSAAAVHTQLSPAPSRHRGHGNAAHAHVRARQIGERPPTSLCPLRYLRQAPSN